VLRKALALGYKKNGAVHRYCEKCLRGGSLMVTFEFGRFGGQFVAETLMPALDELQDYLNA